MTEKEISKQITRYINGELNDREEDQLWVEFLKNRKYYERFETELNLTDLYRNKNFRIDENGDQNQVNESKRGYSAWTVSIAAVLLLSAMLYTFFYQSENEPASHALSEIELTQMLGSDVYRDQIQDVDELDQQINRSLSSALNGETQLAIEILKGLLSRSLTNIQETRILYNLGILAYNNNNFEQSLDYFSDVIEIQSSGSPKFINENSQWYIANIYLKQGDRDGALQLLKEIDSASGLHASDADDLRSMLEN